MKDIILDLGSFWLAFYRETVGHFQTTRGVQFNLLHFDYAVKTAHCVKPIKSLLQ